MLFLQLLLQVFPTLRVGSSAFYYYIILSHGSESVVTQSFLTLWGPMESSGQGTPQTRILECIAVPLSRGSSQPRIESGLPQGADSLPSEPPGNILDAWYSRSINACMLSHFSHVQLFATPMYHSLPGSSVHRILHARILEWVAMPSSMGSSPPWDWTHVSHVSCIGRQVPYHKCHLGRPCRSIAKSFN